ncbi:MAG: globin [Ilumatobacteraceae bacterium]
MAEAMAGTTLYDQVGGTPFFEQLVDAFYDGVADDEVLLRLYPEGADTVGARQRLRLFLIQYWGGPTTYSDERGHPRLRMRHMPFHIGREERDRWLVHMTAAVDATTAGLDPAVAHDVRDALLGYFNPAAESLRNDTGLPISAPSDRR